MARLRYVKSPEEIRQSAEANPEFLNSSVRSIRCAYETDPAVAADDPVLYVCRLLTQIGIEISTIAILIGRVDE